MAIPPKRFPNVNISTVKFNDDAKVSLDVTAYNILSGEEKNITLVLPIYKLWTREHKNDSNVILRYQQPWLNDGEDYIKPTDAIIEDSPEFKAIIQETFQKYKKTNKKEFGNWSLNKNEIKNQ